MTTKIKTPSLTSAATPTSPTYTSSGTITYNGAISGASGGPVAGSGLTSGGWGIAGTPSPWLSTTQTSTSPPVSLMASFLKKSDDLRFIDELAEEKNEFNSLYAYEFLIKDNIESLKLTVNPSANGYKCVYDFLLRNDHYLLLHVGDNTKTKFFTRSVEIVTIEKVQEKCYSGNLIPQPQFIEVECIVKSVWIDNHENGKTQRVLISDLRS